MARLDVAVFMLSTVIMAMKPLLLHLTGDAVRSEVALPPACFQLSVEVLKAVLCSIVLMSRRGLGMSAVLWSGWWHTASFALPAAVYLLMNLLSVAAARMLHPPGFMLLASLKILVTALVSRLLMSKQLHGMQWFALLLLTIGVAIGGRGTGTYDDGSELPEAPILGIVLMLINCTLSSLGGVLTEMALKHRSSAELTIFATNLHMAIHSMVLNGLALMLLPSEGERPQLQTLQLSDAVALGNEALNGILISLLMRRIDAIAKNYVFSASIFTTAGMTALILRHWPPWQFYLSATICAISMVLYAQAGKIRRVDEKKQ